MDLLTPMYIDERRTDSNTSGYSYAIDNLQDNQKQMFRGFSSSLLNFAAVCCLLFMLLGIPGNFITIVALARCKKVRNATAMFIINLSLSDLLFCCFNLPLAASTFYHREWVHGDLMCRLFPLMRYGLLAVSLFTILTITINRYIMIGHPRIYPRIYRRKYLILMVAFTWLSSFGTLIQTWRGRWGKFGLDMHVSSCSILPAENGSSPKEFLFMMAFACPCLAIVLCYARIFYIVRKTAIKTQEMYPKANGSVRLKHKVSTNYQKKSSNLDKDIPKRVISTLHSENDAVEKKSAQSGQRLNPKNDSRIGRKGLSKSRDDDLKFIDTSLESDLPPTLSQLQRKSVQVSTEFDVPTLSSSLQTPSSPPLNSSAIISSDSNQLSSIEGSNANYPATIGSHRKRDLPVDSAVEDSVTISLEQEKAERGCRAANQYVAMPEPSSSSSGIELPYDDEKKPKISSNASMKNKTKIKQKMLKDEKSPKDMLRKKSIANSGASILLAGRMSSKDRRLLKMILVIFLSFLTCYLPITLTKVLSSIADIHFIFIMGYLLVYLTTCINPMIYVVMSSEYRQAYKNLLMCRQPIYLDARRRT